MKGIIFSLLIFWATVTLRRVTGLSALVWPPKVVFRYGGQGASFVSTRPPAPHLLSPAGAAAAIPVAKQNTLQ